MALRTGGRVEQQRLTERPPAAAADRLPIPSLLLLAACAAGTQVQGGFYLPGQLVLGALVVAAAVLARGSVDRTPGSQVIAAAVLAGWSLTCAALAGNVSAGMPGAALVLLLQAAYTVVAGLAPPQRQALLDALLAVGALLALLGIVGVALHLAPLAHADSGVWRAATTLTYENAAAGLLVPLALVALSRCGTAPRAAVAVLLLTGAAATLSRGGLLALAVGLAVLVALGGPLVRRSLPGPLLGAAVAAAGLVPGLREPGPARPVLALAGLLGGVALAALGTGLSRRQVTLAGAALLLVLVAATSSAPVRHAVGDLVDRRIAVAQGDRAGETRAALDQFRESPAIGAGPGRQVLQWQDGAKHPDGSSARIDRYAHDEYLQVLWKTGLIGLGLLLLWLAALVRPALRPERPVARAGCLAALAALAVASALDFLWHLPLIPLVGVLLAGVASPARPIVMPSQEDP